jgi:Sad1 / UNC-like C-terminal
MAEELKPQSWWGTLPGILTATAGIITAIAGLVGALYQAGFLQDAKKALDPDTKTAPPVSKPKVPEVEIKSPASGLVIDSVNTKPPGKAPAAAQRMNLFSTDHGGKLVVASSDDWKSTIDGKEDWDQIGNGLGKEAIYGFKDDRVAAFDTFTMLISGTENCNVKEFELLTSNDLAASTFEFLGKFQTQNVKLFKTPYQEFKFTEVTAKHLKVKLLATHGGTSHPCIHEFQLFGSLK